MDNFFHYGLAEQLVSGSRPQFTSLEFKQFLRKNHVKTHPDSTIPPSLNGLAEGFVQTLKCSLKGSSRSDQQSPMTASTSWSVHDCSSTVTLNWKGRKCCIVILFCWSVLVYLYVLVLCQPYTRQLLSLATGNTIVCEWKMCSTFYKLLGNRPPVYLKATCRMYHVIFHAQHTQTMMLPCRQRQKLPHVWLALVLCCKCKCVKRARHSEHVIW